MRRRLLLLLVPSWLTSRLTQAQEKTYSLTVTVAPDVCGNHATVTVFLDGSEIEKWTTTFTDLRSLADSYRAIAEALITSEIAANGWADNSAIKVGLESTVWKVPQSTDPKAPVPAKL